MTETAVSGNAKNDAGTSPESKQERELSTIDFPYNSLDDAVSVAKAVHKLGGNQCRLDSLAAELGHETVKSGGFRQKLSAAHTFGFTTLTQGIVALTALGGRAADPDQEKVARVEGFLHVPLYNAIYEEFKNGALPPPEGLEAKMVTLGVSNKMKERARQVFQRSAKEAGFFAYGTTKLVYPAAGSAGAAQKPREPEGHTADDGQRKAKNGNGGGGGGDGLHPFIEGLLKTLPPPETEWELAKRAKWLQAAGHIFDLIYTAQEGAGSLVIKVEKGSA